MASSGVHVSCRLRGHQAVVDGDVELVKCLEGDDDDASTPRTVALQTASTTHSFQFDRVFPSSATQQEVYDCIGPPCVEDLMLGYHCTILAYGQTGSGKTHTAIGPDNAVEEDQGLIPRLLSQLFWIVDQDEHRGKLTLSASFVEVYQERLRDLLVPASRAANAAASSQLRIREDKATGSVWVDGATDVALVDLKTARAVVQRGLAQRAVGATRMNDGSSRSHAVFALTMTRTPPTSSSDESKGPTRARLCVVDLAGSEQAKKTKASGTRLDEAKHINKSLSALGNVIHALTSGSSPAYVPYRDSKLTRLLQSSLGGNAKTYLLLTCASAACHVEESLSTLRFGARAKQMQNKPTVNRPLTSSSVGSSRSSQAAELLETLQRKIESLCRYIHELEDAAARGPDCCARCSLSSERDTCTSSQPADEPAVDEWEGDAAACDGDPEQPTSSDVIMQAEVLALRKALVDMQRLQQHELCHALALEQSIVQAEGVAMAELHKRLAQDVARLDHALDEAEAQIAMLQQQLRQSHVKEQELDDKLRQCEAFAKREEAARDAEVEILRRRLDVVERQATPLQLELLASRQEAGELRRRAQQSEGEWRRLREENEALKKRIHTLQQADAPALPVAMAAASPSSIGRSKTLLRPMTVALDGSGSPVHSNAIQSWWTGNNSKEDGEETPSTPLRRTGTAGVVAPLAEPTSTAGGHVRRSSEGAVADPSVSGPCATTTGSVRRERQQLHTSGGSRPFRARLVGLLTSLEEETSSYKELLHVVTTTDSCATTASDGVAAEASRSRPSAARSTKKHRLPELERTTSTTTSTEDEREKP